MPFLQDGGSGSTDALGEIGSALPAATMRVEPDKILALKRRFEDRREIVREFIDLKRDALVSVRPPGTDPCSEKTVAALGENGASALDAARGYINELTAVIDSLSEAARTYGLVEDNNAQAFQQVQR